MGESIKGLITTIQDYSVHDGYGLRSIVFFKGCALRCGWCQNPESILKKQEILVRPKKCIKCGQCIEVCKNEAIVINKTTKILRSRCNQCMECIKACPSEALVPVGKWVTVKEVLDAVLPYKTFFDTSDRGGVTLSGGDPLFQPEFALELLKACKISGLHTALETAAYADTALLVEMMPYVDLWLCDIKHMDDSMHIMGTGVSNQLIKKNLAVISHDSSKPDCVIRIPLVPGYNDSKENIIETARFVKNTLGLGQIDLLPFNYLAASKYSELNQKWKFRNSKTQSSEVREDLKEAVINEGLEVTIGGLW